MLMMLNCHKLWLMNCWRKEYVIDSFPVVPKDKARIRVQLSAAHTKEHLDKA
jgi:hypothetical protein